MTRCASYSTMRESSCLLEEHHEGPCLYAVSEQANWQGPMWNGCGSCNWTRRDQGRPYCAWCAKEVASALLTLAANLAIGAALCRAFDLGRDLQHALTLADQLEHRSQRERTRREEMRDYFHPGCGKGAP